LKSSLERRIKAVIVRIRKKSFIFDEVMAEVDNDITSDGSNEKIKKL